MLIQVNKFIVSALGLLFSRGFLHRHLRCAQLYPYEEISLKEASRSQGKGCQSCLAPTLYIRAGMNKYMVPFPFTNEMRANPSKPNAEVPPFSFVSRFAKGPKITEYEDTHLQSRHFSVSKVECRIVSL